MQFTVDRRQQSFVSDVIVQYSDFPQSLKKIRCHKYHLETVEYLTLLSLRFCLFSMHMSMITDLNTVCGGVCLCGRTFIKARNFMY